MDFFSETADVNVAVEEKKQSSSIKDVVLWNMPPAVGIWAGVLSPNLLCTDCVEKHAAAVGHLKFLASTFGMIDNGFWESRICNTVLYCFLFSLEKNSILKYITVSFTVNISALLLHLTDNENPEPKAMYLNVSGVYINIQTDDKLKEKTNKKCLSKGSGHQSSFTAPWHWLYKSLNST